MTDDSTTRTRRRVRVATNEPADEQSSTDQPSARRRSSDADPVASSDASSETTSSRRRRVRRRDVSERDAVTAADSATVRRPTDTDAASASERSVDTADSPHPGDTDDARTRGERRDTTSRRTRRGGRNRSKGGRGGRGGGRAGGGGGRATSPGDAGDRSGGGARAPAAKSTSGRAGGRGDDDTTSNPAGKRSARGGRRRGNGGTPRGGVSEDVRRSITEGPPRRMLVAVGPERTEIAVLEERDLVEHYVTRKETDSYVGNIYVGRVQNVLPGMEAAFVDIGKGRNGVLYAGEVNYDDDDIESREPRIEQMLKQGQTVVVQVTKDPMGTKGARLTQQLSLAGRYCVLAIEDGTVGISRKLTDAERSTLRETLREIKPDGFGLIVRTAAAGATREHLQTDVDRLVARWEQIQQRVADAKPLTEVYREPELAMRVIRDVFGTEYTELICDDRALADQIRDYLEGVSPELAATVSHYDGDSPLFTAYEISNQVRRALEKKVWLASGGYLIIEKTEAMWVIDVNTGKFVGSANLEETVLRNNIEAADEIARQLRLRDMGGIIVIDFVDMLQPINRDEVLKRFKRELARDKTKSRVMEISKLGLVQMTRKNVSQGLTETFTKTCDCCEGRGAQIIDKALQR